MKVIMKDKEIVNILEKVSLQDLISKINQAINDTSEIFSHLEVDGQSIYEDFEDYLSVHFHSVEVIEIIMRTQETFIGEVLETTHDYLVQTIPRLEALADDFYKSPTAENWNHLAQLTDSISWIFETVDLINQRNELYLDQGKWTEYLGNIQSLKEIMNNLYNAMEVDDKVLIADLILYEIVDTFGNLVDVIKNMK